MQKMWINSVPSVNGLEGIDARPIPTLHDNHTGTGSGTAGLSKDTIGSWMFFV